MWNLQHIEFDNFFSHPHSEYEFKNNCCTLITGENRDKGGNNGAGKTTLFEAIALALTGRTLRDLKKEHFINWESESCSVTLSLRNDVLKQSLTIKREYFRGSKSAKIVLTENDEINSNITSVNEADKRITELLGINREDLYRYFIISQDNLYTFFTAGDTEKKEVLNRITSADMINPLIEKLANNKHNLELQKCNYEEKIAANETRKETLEEQVQELREQAETADDVKRIEERITRAEQARKDVEMQLSKLSEDVKIAEKRIKTQKSVVEGINIDEITKQAKKVKIDIKELQEIISENEQVIRAAKADLKGKVKCPECGEVFIPDSTLGISFKETEALLVTAEKDNKEKKLKLSTLKETKEVLSSQMEEYEEEAEKLSDLDHKVKAIVRKQKDKFDEMKMLDIKITRYTAEREELKNSTLDRAALKKIEAKIKECEDEAIKLAELYQPIVDELEEVNYWIYYMGKNGFKTMLANKAVSIIEGSTNLYLKKFKSDLTVNVNGFKILKDGSVREKIDVFILQDGMNPQVFMGMSGGERGRVKLAGILALQHLINMSLNGRGLNLVILDETLEGGIDMKGTAEFLDILENVGSTILLITQKADEMSQTKNCLRVVKENGVSHYE